MQWKILLTDGLKAEGQAILAKEAQVDDRNGISAEELLQVIGDYDAVIVRGRTKITAEVLDAGKNLKVVGRAGVGVDNIDLEAAKARGITVVNAPQASTNAVAELAIGLMFALARRIPEADAGMKRGEWLKKKLLGTELNGKTLGVIGMGRIGSRVGELAKALGMRIVGYDPLIPADEIARRGAEPLASLDELYAQADVITLHVPLTPNTRGMIGKEAFAKMKPGVFLICAARGGVIDEEALLEALESGQVGGAGLDVFATEPPGDSPLVRHPRVVATPHIGAQTKEAQTRVAEDIATEVLAALKGEPLRWRVV
ncbi:MAG: hypothetical protein GXO56_05530 [Chloroflexi bacterium]|nr:hypothetical protein [Chloroflexota bacterium]